MNEDKRQPPIPKETLGFESYPELLRIQETELEILIKFDEVCRESGLEYFLDAGTLLGAVRHGGFIPWDDDIDVGMPRRDYDKFLEIGQKRLGDSFFLQSRETDGNCPFSFAKIRKRGTTFLEWNKRSIRMNHGIWIDIFPYDCLPEEGKAEYTNECLKLDNILVTKMIPDRAAQPTRSLKWLAGMIARRLKHYAYTGVSSDKLDRRISEAYRRYLYLEDEGGCKSFTCHAYCAPYDFPRDVMLPAGRVLFEGHEFYAPHDTDKFLRILYGDYWKIPPESERVGHRPFMVSFDEEYRV